jgi:hypothetical protein
MDTALPAMRLNAMRKYLSPSTGCSQARFRIARDFGPCRLSAAVCCVMSSICSCSPTAFMCSQRSCGSAAVRRKDCSATRVIVPSSSMRPSSSHQPV